MNKAFEPCPIGSITLPNRIIRSATHEGMGQPDGSPMDALLRLYERLSLGGAGAIITGYMCVQSNGRTFNNMLMFDHDRFIEPYRAITDNLTHHHTPLIAQLAHGGYGASFAVTGEPVVGPSHLKHNDYGDACHELTEDAIEALIDSFVRAIIRAKAAGFDAVQLHAAHGYLLSEFISPKLNKRTDRWGGPLGNRLRIVTEILTRAKAEVFGYPILVKISVGGGLGDDELVAMVRALQAAQCDAIEVSRGYGNFIDTVRMPKTPVDAIFHFIPQYRDMPAIKKRIFKLLAPYILKPVTPLANYNLREAELIKHSVDIPVIVVGGIRSMKDINTILSERKLDFVSMSRPFIIEPNWVNKLQNGQEHSKCIECGYCLIASTSNKLKCYYGKL